MKQDLYRQSNNGGLKVDNEDYDKNKQQNLASENQIMHP